jgi:large subunit ribosomal protein L27
MASTKSTGSTKLGRDSISKRLGVKINHGEWANPGQIIIRQRGSEYLHGSGVSKGADDTLYAKIAGIVDFSQGRKTKFDGSLRHAKIVKVLPPTK